MTIKSERADYYAERAASIRASAEKVADQHTKSELLKIAASFERLAEGVTTPRL